MEFLKKNWARLILATLSLTALILVMINIFAVDHLNQNAEMADAIALGPGSPDFMGSAMNIGYAVFFAGLLAFLVCQMLDVCRCIRGWVLITTGILVTTFMALGLAHVSANWVNAYQHVAPFGQGPLPYDSRWAKFVIFPVIIQLIVFGLFPLVNGSRLLVCSKDECE